MKISPQHRPHHPISFSRLYLITLTALCIACLSGCATPQPHQSITTNTVAAAHDPYAQPVNSKLSIEPDTTPEFQSAFLQDLTAQDIIIIQDEALLVSQRLWQSMDKRARNIRHRVSNIIQAMQAPMELQFIPVAESAYQPYALSPAGALGLWQLMPKTAIELGAIHHRGIDGRRHVEQSSRAAIRYLLQLHDRFDSWTLAICAYNLGPWGVQRRLNKTPWTPDMGLNALPFPRETKHYIKQILGMIALHEQGKLAFSPHTITSSITIQAPVDLNAIEAASGLEKHDLYRLNPGFDYQQYLHHDTHLFLPEKNMQQLRLSLENKPEALQPKYISITTKQGDSLWRIARHHHISINHLRRLNPRLTKVLPIGIKITVPTAGLNAKASSRTNPLLSQGRRIRYKVRSGDSLWKIAKKFGTSAKAIARANQISTRRFIRPGDKLWIIARLRPS